MKRLFALLTVIGLFSNLNIAAQKKKAPSVPDLRPVPGCVLKHELPVINPNPVKIERPYTGEFNRSAGVRLIDLPSQFSELAARLPQNKFGIPVSFSISKNIPGVDARSGAYVLEIGPSEIKITGYDDDALFYGLQSLIQVYDDCEKRKLDIPMMKISDYPALPNRGVVEGFYGIPWSHETRLSILDFMGKNKMNMYVYGPKDDPYHRTPYWRIPYPEAERKRIQELVNRANKNHVSFVWAIHPGGDIRWDKADRDSLMNKFEDMYDLGVRQFAIFFDDIKGKGTDSGQQIDLLNDITENFVKAKPDMKKLIVCPTDYARNRADAGPEGQLAAYGNRLNPDVEVFWTGKVVCGDIEPEAMEFVDTRIKRPALVWWNFPVTDYCKHNLLMGPVYGLDTSLTENEMSGILTNPMENGEASKGALYGVADYGWNPQAYNPLDNWNRSFSVMMPGAPQEFGTFAIHSADPPKNYRRNESWNVDTFDIFNYSPSEFETLRNEFQKIKDAPDKIFAKGGNMPLAVEIAPWLVEFSNLGERGLLALDLIKIYESGDKEKFEKAYSYLNTLNQVQKGGYLDHRSGTLKLQPFIDRILLELGKTPSQK